MKDGYDEIIRIWQIIKLALNRTFVVAGTACKR